MYRGYYYEYAKGVKTGHTEAAGYCLISTAEKDGVRLLCVVLGGKGTARANGTTDFGSFSDTLTAYRCVFQLWLARHRQRERPCLRGARALRARQ